MANIDAAKGFWPTRHLFGAEIRTFKFKVTASQTIYKGDPVKRIAGGTVQVIAAADAGLCIGVAAEYAAAGASGDTYVQVYCDPNIVFGVQADTGTALAATNIFNCGDMITYAAGNTTTKVSIMELDASDVGAKAAMFQVIGLVDEPYNTWGEHANVEVLFNEHALLGSGARPNGL